MDIDRFQTGTPVCCKSSQKKGFVVTLDHSKNPRARVKWVDGVETWIPLSELGFPGTVPPPEAKKLLKSTAPRYLRDLYFDPARVERFKYRVKQENRLVNRAIQAPKGRKGKQLSHDIERYLTNDNIKSFGDHYRKVAEEREKPKRK